MTDHQALGESTAPEADRANIQTTPKPTEVDPVAIFVRALRGHHALTVVPGLHLNDASARVDSDGVAADLGLTGHPYTVITMRWSPRSRSTTADIELPSQGPFTLSNRDVALIWDTAPVTAAMIRAAVCSAAAKAWAAEEPPTTAEVTRDPHREPACETEPLAASTGQARKAARTDGPPPARGLSR